MTIEKSVSNNFDPISSIVFVFDCSLSGVRIVEYRMAPERNDVF